MAEKIVLETEIKTGNSTASVKSVKAELRQLKAEMAGLEIGSAEFTKLAQRAGQLEDAIGDANAAVKAFNPEAKFQAFAGVLGGVANGFSAAQGAMTLFGSESEDINKIMVQTQGAIALATGVNGLLGMKDAFIILGNVIKTQVVSAFATMRAAMMSTGIIALVAVIGSLIYAWYEEKKANEEATKALEDYNDAVKTTRREQQDLAVELLSGRQKELTQITNETTKKILELNDKIAEINKKAREEERVLTKAELLFIESYKQQQLTINEIGEKRIAELKQRFREEDLKKQKEFDEKQKERLKAHQKSNDEFAKLADEKFTSDMYAQIEKEKELAKLTEEFSRKEFEDAMNRYDAEQAAMKRAMELDKAKTNAQLNNLSMISNAMNGFITLAGEQTAAGKALAVAQTTIDTYVAAVRAYKSALDVPVIGTYLAPVAAASAVAAGLANVRRILSVQVPGGGGGGGSVPSAPNMSVPRMTATGNQVSGAGAVSLNSQPQTKVYVVESDIRRVQNKVEVIENNARIG